jgi:RND family efflux transporter MFP subunit
MPLFCNVLFMREWRARAMLAVAAGTIAGCGASKDEPAPRTVQTMVVAGSTNQQILQQTGEIRARNEHPAGFQVDGKIIARPVDVGSIVRRGQVIAVLDPEPQQARLRVANAQVAGAQAELSRATSVESRQRALLANGFIARTQYDTTLRDLQLARAKMTEAQAQLSLARQALTYTTLHAEVDGVVTQVGAQPGQVVAAGQMVAYLVQSGEREALFNVSESAFRLMRPDVPVRVSLATDPTIAVTGQARYVSPQANPATRTYDVRVTLPGAPEDMRLGATVRGEVALAATEGISLPSSALFARGGHPSVWIYDRKDGTARQRQVTVARQDTGTVVIASGLRRGDVVITAGVNSLRPGQRVRPAAAGGT